MSNGYIGESTRHEIAYARSHKKLVRYLEPVPGWRLFEVAALVAIVALLLAW